MDDEPVLLQVARTLPGAPAQAYHAWLDPEAAGRWLFATPGGRMETVRIDPVPGGGFEIAERRGDIVARHYGEYVELDPPRRLAFDFWVEGGKGARTRVTLDIAQVDDGSEITLTHEMPPDQAQWAEQTGKGWTTILDGLAAELGG